MEGSNQSFYPDLSVCGRSCQFYSSNGTELMNNGKSAYLIDYYALNNQLDHSQLGENSVGVKHLFMSRYDCRALLDEDSLIECEGSYSSLTLDDNNTFTDIMESEEEINKERYRELPGWHECSNNNSINADCNIKTVNKDSETTDSIKAESFYIPNAPKGMILPTNERLYKMMLMTAERSVTTNQFEILVKVKQKDNPEFSFLFQQSDLNQFYCYLKDCCVQRSNHDRKSSSSDSSCAPTGLAGLANYDSSGDDSIPSETNIAPESFDIKDNEVIDRQAKRLKQAKILMEHFAKKLTE